MTDDPFLHDDAPYVLGALDPVERAAFEAHLETCAQCRARVAELRGPVAALALVREDVALGAEPLHDPVPDTLLPGIKINTSPDNFAPIEQLQMMRFKGKAWELFGEIISSDPGH